MTGKILPLALLLASVSTPAIAQPTAADVQRAMDAAQEAAAAADRAAAAAHAAADALKRAAPPAAPAPAPAPPSGVVREDLLVPGARPSAPGAGEVSAASEIAEGVANGPNDRLLKASSVPDLQLIATTKEKVASLSWTLDVSGSPKPGHLSSTQFTATVTSALDSSGEAEILGLDGFSGGTEISANFIHYMSRFNLSGLERPQVAVARDKCRTRNAGQPDLDVLCNPENFKGGTSRFVAKYDPGALRPMLREAMPGNIFFLGGELKASQTDFDYLDQAAFATKSVSRFGYGATGYGGIILPSRLTSLTGSFTYARRYKAADPITLCQAINAVPQTQCITAPGAAPKRLTRMIASIEARHAFLAPVGEYSQVAIAPELSFDIKNDAWSIDVPVYLMGDGTGKLRGGVRFAYLNGKKAGGGRDEDFSAGIFVGVPFSLFQ